MMRDSKSSDKKPIQEVQAPRTRKAKLDRLKRKVNEHKKIPEQISSSKELFKKTFLSLDSAAFILDDKIPPRITDCNPTATKIFGYDREEFLGKTTQFLHINKKALKEFQKVLYPAIEKQGFLSSFQYRMKRKSSNVFPTEHSVFPLNDGRNNRTGWISIVRDISARKRMEEQLKQSQEFLANTINALDDTFFVKDEEHRWAALNDAACQAIGRPRKELIGKSDYDCFPKEQADKFWEKDNLVLKTGETNVSEEEVTWRGKVHTISTKKSLFTDFITGKRFIVGTARDITEKKLAENAVYENERFLHNIFNAIQDGVSVLDPELNIVRINPWMEKIYADRMPLVGKKCYNAYQNSKSICPRCPSVRAIETGRAQTEIVPYPSLDKITGWIELSAFPLKDASGKVTGVIEHVKDITERKRAEEALHKSEQKYRALIEQSMHGIVILQDYRIVFANKAACEISGLTMEELHNLSFQDMMTFIPPENRATIRQRLKDRFAGRNNVPQNYELRLISKNGKEFWLNLFFSTVEFQGRPAIQLAFTDITENKRMEESLRQSEASYRELADSITDIFFAMDKSLRYTYWNKASEKLTGIPAEDALGKSIFDIFPDTEDTRKAAGVYQDVLKTQQPQSFKNEYRLKDKDFSFEISAYPSRQGLAVFAKDITERLQAEKKLKQSQEFLANIINALDDPVFVKDEKHRWAVLNDAACEVMGRSREELIGKSDYDLFSKEQADVFWERDNHVVETGQTDVNEEEITWHGKLHIISTKKSLYTDFLTGKKFIAGSIRDMTERKKAEETLIESEEKFRNLAEQSPNMIFINKRGAVVYANKKCEEAMGYKREEFYHPDFDFMTLIAPEFRQLIKTNFGRHMKGEEIEPYEYGLITKNGERLNAIITTKLIKYDGVDSILGTITDITERKKAQAALAESEQRFRKFFENEPEYCYMVSPQGTILEVNAAALNALGYSREEIVDKPIATIYAPESHERMRQLFGQWQKAGEVRNEEMVIITRNGDRRNVLLSAAQVLGEGGKALHTVSIQRDITERKRAQEALHESELTARALLNATTDAVLLIDKEGLIIDVNDRMSEWLGHARKDLIGTIIYDHLPSEIAEHRKAKGYEIVRTSRPISFEDQREGRWLENSVYPILDSHGEASRFAIYSRDITERKQAEEKLLDYQEQLKSLASELTLAEERERRQIATELHDEISQSLFISKMKLEALDKSAPDKKFNDTLDEINTSLGRIIAAMRSLTFDLSSPILYEFGFEEAVAEWLNEQVEKKYGMATELEDDGLPKQLDDDIRVILFRNVRELLINVVKHSRAKKVKVSIQKVGNRIRISVEDDGVGFDSARAESLITKKEAFGLFSIRERLEHLGGNLQIKSSPGCGCRITITSPLKREDIREDK
jgi:PAS domain S-box-containing protein